MDFNLSDVSGPLFLVLYAALAIATIVAVRRAVNRKPGFGPVTGPVPLVDVERDPFEVAYLRGGGGCMLRFAIFELVRRKALRIVTTGKRGKDEAIEATGFAEGDGPGTLLPAIVAFAATPKTPAQVLTSGLLLQANADGAAAFGAPLAAGGLLTSADDVRRGWKTVGVGALVLAVVAAARFIQAAALGHHNVVFLAIEAVFAFVALLVLGRPQRTTARGRAYLERIRAALAPSRPPVADTIFEPESLLVAAAGFDVLAGTSYASLEPFVRTRSSDGSCGGGGDSGGGDGGSGCGGGCGG